MPSTTMKPTAMNATRRLAALPRLGAIAAALILAGCSVTPTLVSQDEVKNRISADTAQMYADQAPIDAPVSLDEALARALKPHLAALEGHYGVHRRLKEIGTAQMFVPRGHVCINAGCLGGHAEFRVGEVVLADLGSDREFGKSAGYFGYGEMPDYKAKAGMGRIILPCGHGILLVFLPPLHTVHSFFCGDRKSVV